MIHRDIFEEEVLTRLPVWYTSRSLDPSYWNFFIDDERIVGMKVRAIDITKRPRVGNLTLAIQYQNADDDDSDDSDCEDADIFVL